MKFQGLAVLNVMIYIKPNLATFMWFHTPEKETADFGLCRSHQSVSPSVHKKVEENFGGSSDLLGTPISTSFITSAVTTSTMYVHDAHSTLTTCNVPRDVTVKLDLSQHPLGQVRVGSHFRLKYPRKGRDVRGGTLRKFIKELTKTNSTFSH